MVLECLHSSRKSAFLKISLLESKGLDSRGDNIIKKPICVCTEATVKNVWDSSGGETIGQEAEGKEEGLSSNDSVKAMFLLTCSYAILF